MRKVEKETLTFDEREKHLRLTGEGSIAFCSTPFYGLVTLFHRPFLVSVKGGKLNSEYSLLI